MNSHTLSRIFIFLCLIPLTFPSCRDEYGAPGKVELYLLESYDNLGEGCAIDEASVILEDRPLILYEDFLFYEPATFTFSLSDTAVGKVLALEISLSGVAFAITADEELVYTGYFWPGYSSLGCQWTTTDPLFLKRENSMTMNLGYPGLVEGACLADNRNHPRILEIFRYDDKLLE